MPFNIGATSTVKDDLRANFISAEMSDDLSIVPGIGAGEVNKKAMHDAGIFTPYQLLGQFLLLKAPGMVSARAEEAHGGGGGGGGGGRQRRRRRRQRRQRRCKAVEGAAARRQRRRQGARRQGALEQTVLPSRDVLAAASASLRSADAGAQRIGGGRNPVTALNCSTDPNPRRLPLVTSDSRRTLSSTSTRSTSGSAASASRASSP